MSNISKCRLARPLIALTRLPPEHPCLWGIADETLVNLLTTAFFASFETDEGERRGIRIVFVGNKELGAPSPLGEPERERSQWSELRFESPRSWASASSCPSRVMRAWRRLEMPAPKS